MITFAHWARGSRATEAGGSDWELMSAPKAGAERNGHDAAGERDCLDACRACQEACLEMAGYSVRMQGYYSELSHIRLLEDCARVCELAQDFILRASDLRCDLAGFCAEIAARCASDCERFDYDQRLLDCAARCRHCAEACRSLAEQPLDGVRARA